jgi:hypothetical protein
VAPLAELRHWQASGSAFYPLAAVLKIGWRIVRASPEEQALLDEHGFGSRRMQ